jgi:hypothetical protein
VARDLTARHFAIRGRHEQRLGDPSLDEIVSCMSFYRYAVPGPRGVLLGQPGFGLSLLPAADFSRTTAERLVVIADNSNLRLSAHARLPASSMTLFELTKRPPPTGRRRAAFLSRAALPLARTCPISG